MRAIRYSLAALAVLALLAASVALVLRSLPGGPDGKPPQRADTAPPPGAAPAQQAVKVEPPSPPPAGSTAAPPLGVTPADLAPLQLSPEQEERIRFVLLSHNIVQSEAADFPLRRGGIVPQSVPLTPLPYEVAGAVPNYRAYSYVIARDRIVIVVTHRREIDLVIAI